METIFKKIKLKKNRALLASFTFMYSLRRSNLLPNFSLSLPKPFNLWLLSPSCMLCPVPHQNTTGPLCISYPKVIKYIQRELYAMWLLVTNFFFLAQHSISSVPPYCSSFSGWITFQYMGMFSFIWQTYGLFWTSIDILLCEHVFLLGVCLGVGLLSSTICPGLIAGGTPPVLYSICSTERSTCCVWRLQFSQILTDTCYPNLLIQAIWIGSSL